MTPTEAAQSAKREGADGKAYPANRKAITPPGRKASPPRLPE